MLCLLAAAAFVMFTKLVSSLCVLTGLPLCALAYLLVVVVCV